MRPDLGAWAPTCGTVHAYSKILGTIRRSLVAPLPHWWHASLSITAAGISTGPLPGGWELVLDHSRHEVVLYGAGGEEDAAPLDDGATATALGERIEGWLGERGVAVSFDSAAWRDDDARPYDPQAAAAGHTAQRGAAELFADLATQIYPWEVSPVQLWPHHFDVSVAVFGTRRVAYTENGRELASPAQIGCGFSPPDDIITEAYFYASPWPFPAALRDAELPAPAEWASAGFEGAVLSYSAAGSGTAAGAFFEAVYELAAPLTLL